MAKDEHILARAFDEDRIVVSTDTDFGAILAAQDASRPSFILFRDPDLLRAEDYIKILLPSMAMLEPDLMIGCVAVFRSGRLRVRTLADCRFRVRDRVLQSRSPSVGLASGRAPPRAANAHHSR